MLDNPAVVRTVFEINNGIFEHNEKISNTDINLKVYGARHNIGNDTKIDISIFVDNSVSLEPKENVGMTSKYAVASSLVVTVFTESGQYSETNLANADESNSVSIRVPKTDNPTTVDVDIYVVAPNQNSYDDEYYYEVIFK